MSIKFIHRRYLADASAKDLKEGRSVGISCKGGITIGYVWLPGSEKIKLAVARCCMTDNFNRRVARDIVTGRLQSKRPGRYEEIDLTGIQEPSPQKIEDIVWGWLENKERLWDAEVISHSVH